jgi:PadR family transcriptional regulator, regulatory protein PadR
LERNQTNLLQGTLDLIILKAIGVGEFHGLCVAGRVEPITRDTFKVGPGSLSPPALHRMEDAGWLTSFWGVSENNRGARYFTRTRQGAPQLGIESEQWATISQAITNALKAN